MYYLILGVFGIMEIGISLGSNKGNRVEFLQAAKKMICKKFKAILISQSSIYETSPVDVKDKFLNKYYLNSFIIINTDVCVKNIWNYVNEIEQKLGRNRTNEINIPRNIDIDIIYVDKTTINTSTLTVPHPRWFKRMFVLKPLAELNPTLILPHQNQSVKKLYLNLKSNEEVKLYQARW